MRQTVHFDLDENNGYCDGSLSFESGRVIAEADGSVCFDSGLDGVDALTVRVFVGCACLEMRPEDDDAECSRSVTVCRFSMSRVNEIGEFCKMVNYYIKTGRETRLSEKSSRRCPKCGRQYAKGLDTCLFCVEKSYLFKRALSLARPYLPRLGVACLFVTLASFFSALLPVIYSRLVDSFYADTADTGGFIRGIMLTVGAYAAAQALSQLSRMIGQRRANKVSSAMADGLRVMVYDKVQRLSSDSMSGKTAGDLIKRISRDTERIRAFITEQGVYFVEKIASFIVILVILLRISPALTVIILAPVPLVVLAITRFWQMIRVRYGKQWRTDSRSSSILHDIVKGIRVVKIFGSEKRETDKFSDVSKRLAEVQTSNEHLWALIFPFLSFFLGIGEFFVLYFGGRLALTSALSPGQLLEFTLFLTYIYGPLRWFSSLPRRLGEVATSLVKVLEITDEKQNVEDPAKPLPAKLDGDVVFDSVTFGYKAYEPVLRDVDLRVRQGEMIGLVGHSGAGKSTLINLVLRLYDADSGSITVGGVDVRDMDQREYRSGIGVVFQETFLFNGSVYDNIAYAKPEASPGEIIEAAKAANAHDFIMALPDGYNTIVGEDGHNLSGGEKQRVSIARAILRDPAILILDEATSALDPETESKIQQALARLVRGRTTFAIAHRLATLRNADRLVVIEKGQIVEVGTHSELVRLGGIYSQLVMAQRQTAKLENKRT